MAVKSHPRPFVYEVQVDDVNEIANLTAIKDRTRVHVKGNPGSDYIYRDDILFADAPPGSIEHNTLPGTFIVDTTDNNFGYIDASTDITPAGLYFIDTETTQAIELAPATGNLRRRHFVVTTDNDNRDTLTPIGTMSLPNDQVTMVDYNVGEDIIGKIITTDENVIGAITLRVAPIETFGIFSVVVTNPDNDVIFSEHVTITGGVQEITLRPDYKATMLPNDYLIRIVPCTRLSVAMTGVDTGIRSPVLPGYLYAKIMFTTETIPDTYTRIGNVEACLPEPVIAQFSSYMYQTITLSTANTLKSLYIRLGISGTSTVIVRVVLLDDSDNLIYTTNVMITRPDDVYKLSGLNIPLMSGDYKLGIKTISDTTDAVLFTTGAILNDIDGSFNGGSDKLQCRFNFGVLDQSSIVTSTDDSYVTIKTGNGYNNLNDDEVLVYAGQEVVITDVKPNQYHVTLTGDNLNRDTFDGCELTMDDIMNITTSKPPL